MECTIEQIKDFYQHSVDGSFVITFVDIKDSLDLLIIIQIFFISP